MINLLQRIKNLWILSGIETPHLKEITQKVISEKPKKMATIIKLNSPIKDFLKNEQ